MPIYPSGQKPKDAIERPAKCSASSSLADYYFDRTPVGQPGDRGRILPPLDTWIASSARGNGSHKAPHPEDLVRIPVQSTTLPAVIVLDPFAGRGTRMVFAKSRDFRSMGIDLNVGYCQQTVGALASITDRS